MRIKTKIGEQSLELIKKYAKSHQLIYRVRNPIDYSNVPDEVIIKENQKFADAVDDLITGTMILNGFTLDMREALISFASCAGIGALRQLANYDMDEIPEQMLKYDVVDGVKVPGLTQRREEEYELYTGSSSDDSSEDTDEDTDTSDTTDTDADTDTDVTEDTDTSDTTDTDTTDTTDTDTDVTEDTDSSDSDSE